MNSPARVRQILAQLSGKSASAVAVLPHGIAAPVTGTLTLVPSAIGVDQTVTLIQVTPTSGPVWQFDPAYVAAVAV